MGKSRRRRKPHPLAARLVWLAAPTTVLPWTTYGDMHDELGSAANVSLADLAERHTLVVYFTPGEDEGDGPSADTMSRVYRANEHGISQLGARAIGVSTQTALAQQQIAVNEEFPQLMLADDELALADELSLPTVEVDGRDEYEPLVLIIRDKAIAHVVYPIASPSAHIDDVLRWLAQNDQRQPGSFSQRDLAVQAQAYLEQVRDETSWTVSLATLDGAEIVCVSCLRARHNAPNISHEPGVRLPAYCTALGKVLLAHLPDDQLEQMLIAMTLERRTETTFTDLATFRAELAEIHDVGWAMSEGEFMPRLHGLAVPIRDGSANVVAAFGVSALGDELFESQPIEQRRPLTEAGVALSERLGSQLGEEDESDGS